MEKLRLRIGEVAHRAGVHRETLRYYERRALLPAPPRQASGYRAYPPETVERVHGRRGRVRAQAGAKIREIDARIERLRAMRQRLRAIVRCRCDGNCPIVAQAMRERKPS